MKYTFQVTVKIVAAWALVALVGGELAQAQSQTPRAETWVTNGPVYAIARTADTVYIGGTFTYVGPNTGHGVPIDTTSGQAVATFPVVNGTVEASIADGAGGWYIGGEFTQVGGEERNRIVHILANGTVNPGWSPDANSTVLTLAVSGSSVYMGGSFTTIGGNSRPNFAQFDIENSTRLPWHLLE
jgi:hypothetical protein